MQEIPDSTHAIIFSDVRFSFTSEEAARRFLSVLFGGCEERDALYSMIVGDTMHEVLYTLGSDGTSAEQLILLRTVKLVRDLYGDIYDPNRGAFDLIADKESILG